jgi:hypothetical protein
MGGVWPHLGQQRLGLRRAARTADAPRLAAAACSARGKRDRDLRRVSLLAILLAGAVLAAPHSGPYDAVLLVVAVGLLLASETNNAPNRLHWLLGFGIWLVPLLSPPAYVLAGRFAPLLTVALIGVLLGELRGTKRSELSAVA